MPKVPANLVESIMSYERDWLVERDKLLKLHHALRIYGISRHSQVIRCLALSVLARGEEDTKKWVREDMKTDPDCCYSEYELKAAIELSRRLRIAFQS